MTVVLPRLARDTALELLERLLEVPREDLGSRLPEHTVEVTYSPVGGARIGPDELRSLRTTLLELAHAHGMPDARPSFQEFEGRAARVIHERLRMTPHEASHEEVWSNLTIAWLLDIAIWRFGTENNNRFIGHLNRNTFRRMWWRAEVLGPGIDLTELGEDELTAIMERPTLFSDIRLARAIAAEHLARKRDAATAEPMMLMREATKRLLRLTPFVAFSALDEPEVGAIVADAFDAAAQGLTGRQTAMQVRVRSATKPASDGVVSIAKMRVVAPTIPMETVPTRNTFSGFDDVAQAALDIARRTGRVTNADLRELARISSDEARDVFRALMESGQLARRGVKRGTHYVLPEPGAETPSGSAPAGAPPTEPPPPRSVGRAPTSPRPQRPSETALRRLLRRGR